MSANTWYNDDGLLVRMGADHSAEESEYAPRSVNTMGTVKEIVLKYDLELLSDTGEFSNGIGYTTDRDNDGDRDGFNPGNASIPAGAYIVGAEMYVTEAAAGGTSIVVGTYQEDGTVIDADGILASILTAALTDGSYRGGDADNSETGALVGAQASASVASYPAVDVTGTFTAGKGVIIIKYIDEV